MNIQIRTNWRILSCAMYSLAFAINSFGRPGHYKTREASSQKPAEIKFQDEVGTILISAQPARPWSTYATELKPKFDLTAKQALEEVFPTTSAESARLLDSIRVSLQAGLPTTTFNEIEVFDSDGEKLPESELTKIKQSGVTPSAAPLSIPLGHDQFLALTNPEKSTEPFLRYLAATALFQEVKILESYLDSLKNLSADWNPYVVRFQFTLQPNSSQLPFDAFVDLVISGLTQHRPQRTNQTRLGPIVDIKRNEWQLLGDFSSSNFSLPRPPISPDYIKQAEQATREVSLATERANEVASNLGVLTEGIADTNAEIVVLPMLVTDSYEAMLKEKSEESIRQFGLAVTAMLKGAGLGAQADNLNQALTNAKGRDLNSTFSIGSLAQDAVRVRMGAQLQSAGRVMVPRTHNVTLLVVIKGKEPEQMSFMASQEFRHTLRNYIPLSRPNSLQSGRLADDIYKWRMSLNSQASSRNDRRIAGIESQAIYLKLPELLALRVKGDRVKFRTVVTSINLQGGNPTTADADWLWTELTSLQAGGKFRTGLILFERIKQPVLPPDQLAIAYPSATNQFLDIKVSGGSNLDLSAMPDVYLAGVSAGKSYNIRPDSIKVTNSSIQAIFPNILDSPVPDTTTLRISLGSEESSSQVYKVMTKASPAASNTQNSSLSPYGGTITLMKDERTGKFGVRYFSTTNHYIEVKNALLTSIDATPPSSAYLEGDRIILRGTGHANLSAANLTPGKIDLYLRKQGSDPTPSDPHATVDVVKQAEK